jgi:hypothetical protein
MYDDAYGNEDSDNGINGDLENNCAICGAHLNAKTRSASQPDLCKACAGEESGVSTNEEEDK